MDSVRLSVAEVTFAKNANTSYGYDKYELIPTKNGKKWSKPMKDFVSVKGSTGSNTTKVTATIAGVKPAFIAFAHDSTVFTVSPTAASSASQEVTITGAALGTNKKLGPKDLAARVNVTGNTLKYNVLGVCTYKLMTGEGEDGKEWLKYKLFRIYRTGQANDLSFGTLLDGQDDKNTVRGLLLQAVLLPAFVAPQTINNSKYDAPEGTLPTDFGRTRPDGHLYIGADGKATAEQKQIDAETTNVPEKTRKIIYVKDVWLTYGLSANAAPEDIVLSLYSVGSLKADASLTLEGYDSGGTFHSKTVTIATVDAENKRITVTGPIGNEYVSDSGKKAWVARDVGGLSGSPIYIGEGTGAGSGWTREGILTAIAHEIGHNNVLNHVDATDDLMNPVGDEHTRILRYRQLKKAYGTGTVSQWHEEAYRE